MKNNDPIDVSITMDEFKEKLKAVFKAEHKTLMTECFMTILQQNRADLATVCKAAMGYEPNINYAVGDRVLCRLYALSDWNFDKPLMISRGMISEDYIDVTITAISKFNQTPYSVKYTYAHEDGEDKIGNGDITEAAIKGLIETFPGDDDIIVSLPKVSPNI